MNRIWYSISVVIFLVSANIINYATEKTYGFPSDEVMMTRVAEAIILAILFYFRANDALMNKTNKIAGFISIVLGIIASIFIWIPIIAGLIYKSRKIHNENN